MRFLQKLERKAKKKVNICKSDYIEHIFSSKNITETICVHNSGDYLFFFRLWSFRCRGFYILENIGGNEIQKPEQEASGSA